MTPARQWIVQIQEYVKADKPTPPGTARIYAYVAKAYADVRARASVEQANEAARQVANVVLPTHRDATDTFAATLSARPTQLSSDAQRVVDALTARAQSDGWQADNNAEIMKVAPKGRGFWVRMVDAGPFAPSAGSWQRWLVPGSFDAAVPPPPVVDSDAFNAQLLAVANASARRDAYWVTAINYWGGVPGSEGPSGIWLNQLAKRVAAEAIARDDREYSRVQSVLAQTLADAFMECWKVKYTYWTARPNMMDPSIVVSMPNPPFPSYVSGHSTISAAAATVLGALTPTHREAFLKDAQQARDSRLYAGIHYPVDNEQGFDLGVRVGNAVLAATQTTTK